MYCNRCGKEMAPGQSFCAVCGAQVAEAISGSSVGRVQRHIQLLASLWFVYSFFSLLGGGALLIIAHTIFGEIGRRGEFREMPGFLQPLLSFVAFFILAKALAGFAAGWGLLQRESWGRPLALVLAFVALLNIPFGTALGIYSLWVLLSDNAANEFRALATSKPE